MADMVAALPHIVAASPHIVAAFARMVASLAHMVAASALVDTGSIRSVNLQSRRRDTPSAQLFFTNLLSCSNLLRLNCPNIKLSVYIS